MSNQKYFIIKNPDEAIDAILKHTVEHSAETIHCRSNDGKMVVIELNEGSEIPTSMTHLKEYTNNEILAIIQTDLNWINPEKI